jgi:hypothetical protein
MNALGTAVLAWLGLSLVALVALLRARPSEPDFYDLTEDQR